MDDFNVAARVQDLCKARSWSLYRLAKEAGMPYSSLSTILYKTAAPSIASIERLCTGFGITLAQFFSAEDEYARGAGARSASGNGTWNSTTSAHFASFRNCRKKEKEMGQEKYVPKLDA